MTEQELTISLTFDPYEVSDDPLRALEGRFVRVTEADGTETTGTVYRACTNDPDGDWVLEVKGYDTERKTFTGTHHEIKHKTITRIYVR